jgi:hypothetical protein
LSSYPLSGPALSQRRCNLIEAQTQSYGALDRASLGTSASEVPRREMAGSIFSRALLLFCRDTLQGSVVEAVVRRSSCSDDLAGMDVNRAGSGSLTLDPRQVSKDARCDRAGRPMRRGPRTVAKHSDLFHRLVRQTLVGRRGFRTNCPAFHARTPSVFSREVNPGFWCSGIAGTVAPGPPVTRTSKVARCRFAFDLLHVR